jgi:hypothetical protein
MSAGTVPQGQHRQYRPNDCCFLLIAVLVGCRLGLATVGVVWLFKGARGLLSGSLHCPLASCKVQA